jgi:hypothetical protein
MSREVHQVQITQESQVSLDRSLGGRIMQSLVDFSKCLVASESCAILRHDLPPPDDTSPPEICGYRVVAVVPTAIAQGGAAQFCAITPGP